MRTTGLRTGAALVALLVSGAIAAAPSTVSVADGEHDETGPPDVVVLAGDVDPQVAVVVVADDGEHRHGYLGVSLDGDPRDSADGAHVLTVEPDSPADVAGLEGGDLIVELDGEPIRDAWSLSERIAALLPGDEVTVEVRRNGSRETFRVELGEWPDRLRVSWTGDGDGPGPLHLEGEDLRGTLMELKRLRGPRRLHKLEIEPAPCAGGDCRESRIVATAPLLRLLVDRPRLGVQLVEVTPELREHLGASADEGVLVSRVERGMPGADAGIEVGDLIVSVDDDTVSSGGELVSALAARDGRTVEVGLVRDGRRTSVRVDLPERSSSRVY